MLKVGPNPDGSGAREVTVVPVESEKRAAAPGLDRGQPAQGGPAERRPARPTSTCRTRPTAGYTNFNRYFFSQADKEGAVIDERFNGGGYVADYIIDYLQPAAAELR